MSEQEAKIDAEVSQKKQVRREQSAMRERWSYIILVIIVIIMFVISDGFMFSYVSTNNHAWCEIIQTSRPPKPPVMPADPKAHPAQVKQYNNFQIVSRLSIRLGCGVY